MLAVTGATSTAALVVAVFGASSVEMVEALTLVVAAGTRSWRSALEGSAVALLVLAVVTAAVGIPLARYLPIDTLRVVVGTLLLMLGLSWLRKAVLRSGGRLAKHDEDAIYEATAGALGGAGARSKGRDTPAFLVAFKGVMLEGSEVVLIVVSLGTSAHRMTVAAASAAAAVVLVGIVGAMVARQLSSVPENALKTGVGIMLTSFGVFWVGEGAGVNWPGGDLTLPVLIAWFAVGTAALVALLRRGAPIDA
ncbi:MAG TPA: hypothetical protein VMR97_14745, partial [Acidimicrobiales bacterium]|nr:hypothetical protein [Acidimicrobiales bacterium]